MKSCSFIVFFILSFWFVHAQDLSEYTPPSPNAASLGEYGRNNVNFYNGLADISIPLLDVKTSHLAMPITLQYNASGIRTAEESSWVGLNWVLNAGGVITRVKRDKDDFTPLGFFKALASGLPNCYDTEPDMFYYNINGKIAGSFVLTGSQNNAPIVKQTTTTLDKITGDLSGNSWTIKTSDGTVYLFSKKEFTTNLKQEETFVSSWFLSEIKYPNNETIKFFYTTSNSRIEKEYFYANVRRMISYNPSTLTSCPSLFPTFSDPTLGATFVVRGDKVTYDEVVLSSIETNEFSVRFSTSDRIDLKKVDASKAKKLDKIILFDKIDPKKPTREFRFSYDYFSSSTSGEDHLTKRLRLTAISETSSLQLENRVYSISYNHNQIPAKKSLAGSSGFISNSTEGLISRINYPTGGFTAYDFEEHVYQKQVGQTSMTFNDLGARIKEIFDGYQEETFSTKTFTYENGRVMGDLIHVTKRFDESVFNVDNCPANGISTTASFVYETTIFSDFSSLAEGGGSLIGYDKVTVYEGTEGQNGKTEYVYYNTPPVSPNYTNNQTPVPVPLSMDPRNGQLKESKIYRRVGTVYELIAETIYNLDIVSNGVITARRKFDDNCTSYTYDIKFEWPRLTKKTDAKYDGISGQVVTNYEYTVADELRPSVEKYISSDGSEIKKRFIFPLEKMNLVGGIYSHLVAKNVVDQPVETIEYVDDVETNRSSQIFVDWFGDNSVIKPSRLEVSKRSLDEKSVTLFLKYDKNGNLLEFQESDGIRTSLLRNSFNNRVHAIARNSKPLSNSSVSASHEFAFSGSFNRLHQETLEHFSDWIALESSQIVTLSLVLSSSYSAGASPSVLVEIINSVGDVMYDNYSNGLGTFNNNVAFQKGLYRFRVKCNGSQSGGRLSFSLVVGYQKFYSFDPLYYTSFEDETGNNLDVAKSGKKSHAGLFKVPLPNQIGNYILTWWSKSGITAGWVLNKQDIDVVVASTNSYFNIGSASTLIDEVRLHPKDAQMTSYSFSSNGKVTSMGDLNSRINKYYYDEFDRLLMIRDEAGNIIEKFCYGYNGRASTCELFGNQVVNTAFLPVCSSPCQIPAYVTYSVPANTYFASTQVAANALAAADVAKYGQAFANKNESCSLPVTTNILASNTTATSAVVIFRRVCDSQGFTFNVNSFIGGTPTSGGVTLGNLPTGVYDISFSRSSGSGTNRYRFNSASIVAGEFAELKNVTIYSSSNNRVVITTQ